MSTKPQTPETPKDRILAITEQLRLAKDSGYDVENQLKQLSTLLDYIKTDEKTDTLDLKDAFDALAVQIDYLVEKKNELAVQVSLVIVNIRKGLEDLRTNIDEYYVPVAAAGAAAQSGFSKLWGKTTTGFGGMFAKVKEFFGMGGDKKSSVGNGFGLQIASIFMSFVPDSFPGMKERKADIKMRIVHVKATREVEQIVAEANKGRESGDKVAVNLSSYETYKALATRLAEPGAMALAALRNPKQVFSTLKPITWLEIVNAPPLVVVAQAKPPAQERAETPSPTL